MSKRNKREIEGKRGKEKDREQNRRQEGEKEQE